MEVCAPHRWPAWLPPSQAGSQVRGERRVLHVRGRGGCSAGLGAGVKGPGWVVGGEEGAGAMLPPWHGWESPGSQLCRCGAGKQLSFSSSLLPASRVPAPKGEGRKEGEHPSLQGSRPGARAQTYSCSWERASLRSWEGKMNRKPLLTHPNTALLARGHVEHGLCKGFKPQFPG